MNPILNEFPLYPIYKEYLLNGFHSKASNFAQSNLSIRKQFSFKKSLNSSSRGLGETGKKTGLEFQPQIRKNKITSWRTTDEELILNTGGLAIIEGVTEGSRSLKTRTVLRQYRSLWLHSSIQQKPGVIRTRPEKETNVQTVPSLNGEKMEI